MIKVCGMRDPENIRRVVALGIDWIGFIFHPASLRYVGEVPIYLPDEICSNVRKIGVFVNDTQDNMLSVATAWRLDYLQLHGSESPELCYSLRKRGMAIIKTIAVASADDLRLTADYEGYVDYFLFDTKCETYGGSGKSFDWSLLHLYKGNTPFLLSGGLNMCSADQLKRFHHPRMAGVDLNSGFETSPGFKDDLKLKDFINRLKTD